MTAPAAIDFIIETLRRKTYKAKSYDGRYYDKNLCEEEVLKEIRIALNECYIDILMKLAELEAKTTTYEAIIKNSNFKPILEYKTIFKDENGRIEGI